MTDKTSRILGIATGVIGMALLVLNAVDYLAGWYSIPCAVSAAGIMLAVIGAWFPRSGGEQPEKK